MSVPFVCLSVCQQGYAKTAGPISMALGGGDVTGAKEEPITFRSTSESQGGSTNCFSLSLTLRDKALGLGRGLHRLCAVLVISFIFIQTLTLTFSLYLFVLFKHLLSRCLFQFISTGLLCHSLSRFSVCVSLSLSLSCCHHHFISA